ncbi:M16 family metallopeptidase [Planctomycetes bacterium K23_9]|uniref:Protease 3 n=1 Tax=Stieleria marina TaxID=1930275 RepID=A0A517NQE8_9BACT|nr:Protease 3 precursor [Planctomycetes bacterium K23_9]
MIDFELIDGPFGVPIYFQHLNVNTVSLNLVMFVGSADDDVGGGHGIYHWFEHLPSRGTEKFPGGYRDTEARLVRHGGAADAETGYTHTSFSADVPRRVWAEALDVLVDMMGRPLLRTSDIEAEREIILQEIDEWHSGPSSHSLCQLPEVLWPGHPLGHDQLGTRDTLAGIDPALLRQAHQLGYSRGRCAVFVAGNLPKSELIDVVGKHIERLPKGDISTRKSAAKYGELPDWQAGAKTQVDMPHDDSVVYLLFPIESLDQGESKLLEWDFLSDVFSAGDLGSPLQRLVREDSRLAYSPEFISATHPDGGYAGLVAQTSAEPERVLEAFWKLIESDELRSREWLDYVRDTIRGSIEMHDPDAGEYTSEASASLIHYGRCFSDSEYAAAMLGYRDEDVAQWLERLTQDQAHAVVFRGRG